MRDPQAIAANRRLRIQALDGRGWAFRLLGDMEAYARDSQEVARLARLMGDQATLAHLRWREAYADRWFCRYGEAGRAAAEGVRLSQTAGDRYLEARCWREVGMVARETGRYEEAQDALERALEDGHAQPLNLATADFDEDGIPNLNSGYASPTGGILTLHMGSVDAIYPNSPKAQKHKAEDTFTDVPFLSPACVLNAPVLQIHQAIKEWDTDWNPRQDKNGQSSLIG